MLQVIQKYNTGELLVEDVAPPALQPGGILVRTMQSLISAGTERNTVETAQKSLAGKAKSRPDLVKKVIQVAKRDGIMSTYRLVKNKLDSPVPLGYSNAGIVIAVAEDLDEFSVGDHVACAGQGYASHAEIVFVPRNLAVRIPEGIDFDEACYATLGAIALQGIRQAETLVGETVAVIGLGLLGILSVQILKANGCRVIGLDLNEAACENARNAGADHAMIICGDTVTDIETITRGYGVDSSIITAATSSTAPVILSGDILRHKGKLIIEGAVPADIPRSPFYEKEIDVRFARSYGPGRYDSNYEEFGIDYPYGYVRWTENRNMQAFLGLAAQKKINLKSVTTHRFKIEDAKQAYDMITGKNPSAETIVGVLLDYRHRNLEVKNGKNLSLSSAEPVKSFESLSIGFIGAGNFAQNMLLPHFKKMQNVRLTGVSTSKGVTAKNVADKFKFQFSTTDNFEIIRHPEINALFVTTRHHLHAPMVMEALKASKPVFVEKPLAMSTEELDEIVRIYQNQPTTLMVGYNRRFSPVIREVKKFYSRKISPLMITYRINAGNIPKNHWIQDPVQGGGRIIGEVCHFIDLMIHLLNAMPVNVYAQTISYNAHDVTNRDNLQVIVKFSDGSTGTISYIAIGDKTFPKERIEIFGEQSVAVVDDFKNCRLSRNGKSRTFGGSRQDKGYADSILAFTDAILKGQPSPIPFDELVMTSKTVFAILGSLTKGLPVGIS